MEGLLILRSIIEGLRRGVRSVIEAVNEALLGTEEEALLNRDPIMEVVAQNPREALRFIKLVMLFGASTGFVVSVPCIIYLSFYWGSCKCNKPLQWWVLVFSLLQISQVPVRYLFFFHLHTTPDDRARIINTTRILTGGRGWKCSKFVSILSYAWFILGVVWVFNAYDCSEAPGLWKLTVAAIVVSMLRLVTTFICFWMSFPPSANGGQQSETYRGAATAEQIARLPLYTYAEKKKYLTALLSKKTAETTYVDEERKKNDGKVLSAVQSFSPSPSEQPDENNHHHHITLRASMTRFLQVDTPTSSRRNHPRASYNQRGGGGGSGSGAGEGGGSHGGGSHGGSIITTSTVLVQEEGQQEEDSRTLTTGGAVLGRNLLHTTTNTTTTTTTNNNNNNQCKLQALSSLGPTTPTAGGASDDTNTSSGDKKRTRGGGGATPRAGGGAGAEGAGAGGGGRQFLYRTDAENVKSGDGYEEGYDNDGGVATPAQRCTRSRGRTKSDCSTSTMTDPRYTVSTCGGGKESGTGHTGTRQQRGAHSRQRVLSSSRKQHQDKQFTPETPLRLKGDENSECLLNAPSRRVCVTTAHVTQVVDNGSHRGGRGGCGSTRRRWSSVSSLQHSVTLRANNNGRTPVEKQTRDTECEFESRTRSYVLFPAEQETHSSDMTTASTVTLATTANDTASYFGGTPAVPQEKTGGTKGGTELSSVQENCCICLGEFQDTEMVRELYCTHFFHQPCIDRWLLKNKQCPLCLRNIDAHETTSATPAPRDSL